MSMNRITISPIMLEWACDRAGYDATDLAHRFPRLSAWIRGESAPTLKQIEAFAKATYTPVGYLFLQVPPVEAVPIPDFRTIGNIHAGHPSPDLLDTLYVCQQRQAWFRDYARSMGEDRQGFVGSMTVETNVVAAADTIRETLGFDVDARRHMATWTDALRHFIEQAEDCGIMVMCNGVVNNNNHRRLDPEEFRGFAMVDDLAPLVFINGADTKAAQMFTLAHELVHIWLGQTALSDAGAGAVPGQSVWDESLYEPFIDELCGPRE